MGKNLPYTSSKIFVTGVSADNFGGDTEYPFGIVKESQDRTPQTGLWESIPPDDIENWEQDEDVLDTWASSWLWPLATMGWPDEEAMAEKGWIISIQPLPL